jgi:hypothetical protein
MTSLGASLRGKGKAERVAGGVAIFIQTLKVSVNIVLIIII